MDKLLQLTFLSNKEIKQYENLSKIDLTDRINFMKQYNIELVEDDHELIWAYKNNWLGDLYSPLINIIDEAICVIETYKEQCQKRKEREDAAAAQYLQMLMEESDE